MTKLKRGMIVDVDLNPTKVISGKENTIDVGALREAPLLNRLTKKSIADCLQTRPIDHCFRLIQIRGELESEIILKIDEALKIVFAL